MSLLTFLPKELHIELNKFRQSQVHRQLLQETDGIRATLSVFPSAPEGFYYGISKIRRKHGSRVRWTIYGHAGRAFKGKNILAVRRTLFK